MDETDSPVSLRGPKTVPWKRAVSEEGGGSSLGQHLLEQLQEGKIANLNDVTRLVDNLGKSALQELRTNSGVPVLNHAILTRNPDVARLLVDKGVNPLLRDSTGQTALHAAAKVDNSSVLLEMLSGADVNVQDDQGDTPLHVAVRETSVEAIRFLVFAGADPNITNKDGLVCRMLTRKNQILQILRDYTSARRPSFTNLATESVFNPSDLPFMMQLSEQGHQMTSGFLYCTISLDEFGQHVLEEDDEALGPVVVYRLQRAVSVDLVVPLCEEVDDWQELVLRLLPDIGGKNDVLLDVKEGPPRPKLVRLDSRGSMGYPSGGLSQDEAESIVCHADATVILQAEGAFILLYRPVQQPIILDMSNKEVLSRVSGAKLKVGDNFQGQLRGRLQLEPSAPIHEKPSMDVQVAGDEGDVDSQTEFIKLLTQVSRAEPGSKVYLEVNESQEYNGGDLAVYTRPLIADSETSEDDSEDEKEARRWTKQDAKVRKLNGKLQIRLTPNKTTTVVEIKRGALEDKVKRKVAKQHRKRHHKKAVFFVIVRPWAGWRECREIKAVVTSPAHVANALKPYLSDGYTLVQLSGHTLVPNPSTFKVSIVGDLIIEDGTVEAICRFHHALNTKMHVANHCSFVVRGKTTGTQVQSAVEIEREAKVKKKKAGDGNPRWKAVGRMRFHLTFTADQEMGRGRVGTVVPFTDNLLIDLADQMLPSEAGRFGIKIGLNIADVDGIMTNSFLHSPVFRCFEILRLQRTRCNSAVTFGKALVKGLQSMGWNEQCEWLFQQLSDWDGLSDLQAVMTP